MTANFKRITKKQILSLTNMRKYETKLGEVIDCCKDEETPLEEVIKSGKARYVLFGVPEDAGIQANLGMGGARSLWTAFLKSFLNIQSNDYFSGEQILALGAFDFSEEIRLITATAINPEERLAALRSFVEKIDMQVEEIVKIICRNGKIPVIIGGGHNNAYGAIKGAAKGLYSAGVIPLAQISAINLDAHPDYRMKEGRHSGNAFRYADDDGYLNKYFALGVHENYLQDVVVRDMQENPFIDYITYEDIFLKEKFNFTQAVARATGFVEDNLTGVELDLDCIENVVSSAMTPSGLSALNARFFLHFIPTEIQVAYLHICEGSSHLDDGTSSKLTGKLVSYLVSDFVKSHYRANS